MVPNKRFFVYLQKKLGANKHLFIYKKSWGQINNFGWEGRGGRGEKTGGGEKYTNLFMSSIFLVFINTTISKGV